MQVLLLGSAQPSDASASAAVGPFQATLAPAAGGGSAAQSADPPPLPSTDTLLNVMELLCFCVRHHNYRIKYYVLRNNLVDKVLRLASRRERSIVLAAVRLLRCCVELRDNFYDRYLVKNDVFSPVVRVFCANGQRNNLLNSTVLELFDFIRRSNQKALLMHVIERHGDALAAARVDDYCDTLQAMRTRYEQYREGVDVLPPAAPPVGVPASLLGLSGGGERRGFFGGPPGLGLGGAAGDGAGASAPSALGALDGVLPLSARFARSGSSGDLLGGGGARHGSMDAREESYFEGGGDDEEEEGRWHPQAGPPGTAASAPPPPPHARAASPPASPLARLVDYGDEEPRPAGALRRPHSPPSFLPLGGATSTSPPMWLGAGGDGAKRLRLGAAEEADMGGLLSPKPLPLPPRRQLPIRPIVLMSLPSAVEAAGAEEKVPAAAEPEDGAAPEIT
jgi:hypothetical protein